MADRLGDARRKIGTDNAAASNGSSLQDDLNSLNRDKPQRPPLRAIEPRGVLPVKAGRADYKVPATGTGGGIASPLEETDYSTRTHWPERTLESVDGILSFRVKPIKSFTQADANSAEVVQKFAEPPA